ncbi:N-acyl-D-amino-acid deacylase family protein [Flavisphingomonas formosensis]|uniref:N-acyl-D-amino-acid deacylase family protein n=1 Tax=Flavisphingomonas formosensis TaxID=861534 RepID=UPI0012F7DCBF|nr:amidohydrolase family protein [Sphingomonas formosensis]
MTSYLIRGGTIVDGTLKPAYQADLRVAGGRIDAIGPNIAAQEGDEIVDAAGCYVTPGFIEPHTHFDATMWWQNDLNPLPGYGATTIVMGNCGFSAAPISDDLKVRDEIVGIFAFFEDIDKQAFVNELPWDWRKWSEYKASMTAKVKLPLNYASFVGHIAIRLAVMGLDAWTRAATDEEIARMCELLDDACKAGAMGLSTNQLDFDGDERPVPTFAAEDKEYRALFEVLDRNPGSVCQVVMDTFIRLTCPAALERFARLTEGLNVRVQWGGLPTLEFQKPILGDLQKQHEQFKAEGRDFWTAYTHVSPTNTLSLTKSLIFAQSGDFVWHEVVAAESWEEKERLLADPDWRARARESWDTKAWAHAPMNNPDRLLLRNSDNGVGPMNLTLVDYMKMTGIEHRSDAMADWILRNGVKSTVHMAPFPMNEEVIIELIRDPKSVGNVSDAGAHAQMFCGPGENMLLFTYYVRQGKITIEEAVHVQTGKLAEHFNLADRGVLRVGAPADITVFNINEIERREERKIFDAPDGMGGITWRYTRDPAPMRLTLVNGVPTFDRNGATGTRPGEFLAPSAAPAAFAEAAE